MRHFAISILLLCTTFTFSQTNVTWGEEFKLKKGSTDLSVFHTDNSGIYLKESHFALRSYFVIGATVRESASLIKLDKNLTKIYENDFNKELKGKEYDQLFFLNEKLFLFATDYNKKEKTLTLFSTEINKNTGEQSSDWKEVTSWQKDEKNDDIDYKLTYNGDSTKMVIVSTISGKEKNNYQIRQFNDKMIATNKPIAITNEFEPKTFQLEDVVYVTNGNVVLVGRVYEYLEGKKKKNKFLDFKNYNIRIYDKLGKQIKEINTDINAKWLVSGKVLQMPSKELVLAAFYSNAKKGSEINGFIVQRIDATNGNIISANQKDINTAALTTLEDDNDTNDGDDESKKERKERERLEKIQSDEEGFSKYMRFRNVVFTPDNGIVILAEKYHSYFYTTTSYSYGGVSGFGNTRTTSYHVYECGDLMMTKIDASGNINWLNVMPKEQREIIQTGYSNSPYSFSVGTNFFDDAVNMPFYAGFGLFANDKKINIIFNDHKKNVDVLQLGQKVKRTSYFGKTDCFALTLDAISGKYTRKSLFSNNDVPTAMPRLGSILGNDFYMIGKEDRIFAKTKIAVAKLTLKN